MDAILRRFTLCQKSRRFTQQSHKCFISYPADSTKVALSIGRSIFLHSLGNLEQLELAER